MMRLNKLTVHALVLLCLLWPWHAGAGQLTVTNGQFSLDGKSPFRAVGVNYFDAINRTLNNPGDRSALLGLRMLARYEVPFVRVMFGGFWPNELRVYLTDPARYFAVLDEFVGAAEQAQVGIVASLAWNYAAIPDLVGEPASAWGRPDSKTHQLFRRYVSEVVGRYHKSPAIWMWEFGNEMALYADLPNSDQWRPKIDVLKGTPAFRGPPDDLKGKDVMVALAEFSKTVRVVDATTPISSGNALPRPYAFNNARFAKWTADSDEQFCEMLGRDNPAGFDSVSIHIYPHYKGYFGARDRDYNAILAPVARCAKRASKPVFAGEFGVAENESHGDPEGVRGAFNKLLDSLVANDVGLAAAWVFDFSFQNSSYNITAVNQRAYQLEELRRVNRVLRAGK
jgi:hypothetical protein